METPRFKEKLEEMRRDSIEGMLTTAGKQKLSEYERIEAVLVFCERLKPVLEKLFNINEKKTSNPICEHPYESLSIDKKGLYCMDCKMKLPNI